MSLLCLHGLWASGQMVPLVAVETSQTDLAEDIKRGWSLQIFAPQDHKEPFSPPPFLISLHASLSQTKTSTKTTEATKDQASVALHYAIRSLPLPEGVLFGGTVCIRC